MARASKHRQKDKAREEIAKLMLLAESADETLARRYVTLCWKRASRLRISMRPYTKKHCRKCKTFWTSNTLKVRTRPQSVVYTCLHCGEIKRFRKYT